MAAAAPMLEAMREAAAIAIASMTFPPLLNWAENAKSVAQHHRKDPRFATIGSTIGEIVRQHGAAKVAPPEAPLLALLAKLLASGRAQVL